MSVMPIVNARSARARSKWARWFSPPWSIASA